MCVWKEPGGIQGLASVYFDSYSPQLRVNISFITTNILITERTEARRAAAGYRLDYHSLLLRETLTQS